MVPFLVSMTRNLPSMPRVHKSLTTCSSGANGNRLTTARPLAIREASGTSKTLQAIDPA